jgi:hypothetical protein
MKSRKTPIKIVKGGERACPAPPLAPPTIKEDGPGDFSREVTSTVKGWVREFQESRRAGKTIISGV